MTRSHLALFGLLCAASLASGCSFFPRGLNPQNWGASQNQPSSQRSPYSPSRGKLSFGQSHGETIYTRPQIRSSFAND